jgi:hypothetical protein
MIDYLTWFQLHDGGIFPNLVLIIEIIKMKRKKPPALNKKQKKI